MRTCRFKAEKLVMPNQLPALRNQRTAVCEVRCRSQRRDSELGKASLFIAEIDTAFAPLASDRPEDLGFAVHGMPAVQLPAVETPL